MKRPGVIIGGVILVALLVVGIYVAAKIALPLYMMAHRDEIEAKLAEADKRQQEQLDALNIAQAQSQAQPQPAPIDNQTAIAPNEYRTEDDWLAGSIAREIATMSAAIAHPDEPLPDLKIQAQVNSAVPSVHVEIDGTSIGDVTADLTPTFAWDFQGYVPLAEKCLNGSVSSSPDDSTDVLANLQDLTGYNLAKADVRISEDLQKHPASSQDHEAAALALCALALRENAAGSSDARKMLCRATAHLAMAQALRGSQPATWPGLVADATIRTLAGREVDAVAHLDTLAGRSDLPASARPWLVALKTEARQDWRIAQISSSSPLLLRIAWFQVLANDFDSAPAVHRLDQVVPPPPADANEQIDPNAGGEWQLPDWGRAVIAAPAGLTVDNGARFTEQQIPRELQELNQVFSVEGAGSVDGKDPGTSLNERENDSVVADASGKPVWKAIGLGTFKDATRRHLFVAARAGYAYWLNQIGSAEEAESFRARMQALFHGVPDGETEISLMGAVDLNSYPYDSAKPWEVPAALAVTMNDGQRAKDFYRNGVPFGTTFDAHDRLTLLGAVDDSAYLTKAAAIQEQIKNLPIEEQAIKFHELSQPLNKAMEDSINRGPTAWEKRLLVLNPDNYDLATDHLKGEALFVAAQPFLDYNLRPYGWLELKPPDGVKDAEREVLLRHHAVLNPSLYFELAGILREDGKPDEAAAMDRLGVAGSDDEVTLSASVRDLVDYDLDHGLSAEAEQVAKRAGDTASAAGMETQMHLFERQGQLDQAAALGEALQQNYGYDGQNYRFYARHKDHFPDQYGLAVTKYFPEGMARAEFDSFYQPPDAGVRISLFKLAAVASSLKTDDVIVALDGYRVKSVPQYDIICGPNGNAPGDFIVWRKDKYVEVKSILPPRFHDIDLELYGPLPH